MLIGLVHKESNLQMYVWQLQYHILKNLLPNNYICSGSFFRRNGFDEVKTVAYGTVKFDMWISALQTGTLHPVYTLKKTLYLTPETSIFSYQITRRYNSEGLKITFLEPPETAEC
jgi:hypothetical protein